MVYYSCHSLDPEAKTLAFFLFFWGGGNPMVLRGYFWLFTQESLLVALRVYMGCWGLNPRKMPSLLYYLFGPLVSFLTTIIWLCLLTSTSALYLPLIWYYFNSNHHCFLPNVGIITSFLVWSHCSIKLSSLKWFNKPTYLHWYFQTCLWICTWLF